MKKRGESLTISPRLRDQIYALIREEIKFGLYEPGERVTEISITERLGVSRTPVREALCQLARGRKETC